MNNYITAEMDYWDFSGVIRIIQNGEIVFETSRGYSNIEFSIKNTMETRFTIASVTKQFTAFAIMILYDKGLLRLDEKANRYLPSNMQLPSEITVHHLLSHTSGLHNNSNYNLLAWVIEYVSGQTYNEFLEENIFSKLGMNNTVFDNGLDIIPNKANNYMRDYGVERYDEGGITKYAHGGDALGVSAYTQYYFDEGLCIIIISNTESIDQYRFGNGIAAIMHNEQASVSHRPDEILLSSKELEKYTGTQANNLYDSKFQFDGYGFH